MGKDRTVQYLEAHKETHLELLRALVRQPSISSQGVGMDTCASLLQATMERAGIATTIHPTNGHPVLIGERAGASEFTILFYGHYDVQPPEPLDAWDSPPFELTIRNDHLFGRGVSDNKGQLLAHLLAVQALLETEGELPVSVKFIFEGEEESGSRHLPELVEQQREQLTADLAYTADGARHPSGRPIVCLGARGILYVEAETKGANNDYHSGNKGGVLPAPAWELIHFLGALRDSAGRVQIPGFYDGVTSPTHAEQQLLAAIPFDQRQFLHDHGLQTAPALDPIDHYRALMFEPTLNIAGLVSGHTGQGAKTIIPHQAKAKLDMRLVSDQDPDKIFARFAEWTATHFPEVQLRNLWSWPPSRTDSSLPVCREIVSAVQAAAGEAPVVLPSLGGSLPDFVFTRLLGIPSVIVPYANHDQANHAPNENYRLDYFFAGIGTTVAVLRGLGDMPAGTESRLGVDPG